MGDAHVLRAEAARRTVADRFLAAATTSEPPGTLPLAFPAHMPLRTVRTTINGGIMFSLQIPPEFSPDAWQALVRMAGNPLAVTLEVIDPDEADPFDDNGRA